MDNYSTLAIATIPALLSFFASYLAFKLTLAKYKRQIMPELAVKKLLSHKGYTDRSFKAISESLGGWDDNHNELRKILVRAGAIRINKNDKGDVEECWYLLERETERIEKIRNKHNNLKK
jgi:hypothetical protein